MTTGTLLPRPRLVRRGDEPAITWESGGRVEADARVWCDVCGVGREAGTD